MTTPPAEDDDLGLLGSLGNLTAAANNPSQDPEVRAIAAKTAERIADQARQRRD